MIATKTGSRSGIFALSLFATSVVAKLPILIERGAVPSVLWLVALVWQDALLTLIALPLFRVERRLAWIIYFVAVAYIAMNSALALVLGSPLTLPMFRATGGALQDSITYYLTAKNLSVIFIVLAAGILLSQILPRCIRVRYLAIILAVIVGAGGYGARRTNTDGLDRNAIVAFARSLRPRIRAENNSEDWRASSSASGRSTNLLHYTGAAANRNVVLISLESTGIQYLGLGGAARDPMPNISALAREALLFDNAYAVYPESIKGLFCVLCSRYPAVDTSAESLANSATLSIAHVLSRCSYTNALFHSGRFMYLGMDSVIAHRGFHFRCDAGDISGNTQSSFGIDEAATVASMLNWVDALSRGQRFFLAYLPIAGHHPYDAPAGGPFDDSTERGRYLNSLWWGDKALGTFLDGLRFRGLYTNSLFVIYGDHGEAFGQHPGNYGHTLQIYEENVKVPLFFAAPGLIPGPIHVDRVASLLDVTPTTLNLLGLEVPITAQGTSMLAAENQTALFFTDYSLPLLGLRDGPWKFIHDLESGHSYLFDLSQDPREQTNLAHQNGSQVAAYRERLIKWASAQRWEVAHSAQSLAVAHRN